MTQCFYHYHIRVASKSEVRVEKRDPANKVVGEPSGKLRLTPARQTQIQELIATIAALPDTEGNPTAVRRLGDMLFEALFEKSLSYDLLNFYEQVRNTGAYLRFTLDIDSAVLPQLAALPWEFLSVPSKVGTASTWIGTDPNIAFARRRSNWQAEQPITLKANEALRVALVVSAPVDAVEQLGAVKFDRVWAAMQAFAGQWGDKVELIDPVEDAGPDQIDDLLRQYAPHILHFVGHGRLGAANGGMIGELALTNNPIQKRARWTNSQELRTLLNRNRPAVVVLQACEGGSLSSAQGVAGVAAGLADQNIPVVVAMQYIVSNVVAERFAREFYDRLAAGEPVDRAVQEGRLQVAKGPWGYSSRDFATPVIYMRAANGEIFARENSKASSSGLEESTAVPGGRFEGEQLDRLIRLVAACPAMRTESQRDSVVNRFDVDLRGAINRSGSLLSDTEGIVRSCNDSPGGIVQLVKAISFYDARTYAFGDLASFLRKYRIDW